MHDHALGNCCQTLTKQFPADAWFGFCSRSPTAKIGPRLPWKARRCADTRVGRLFVVTVAEKMSSLYSGRSPDP